MREVSWGNEDSKLQQKTIGLRKPTITTSQDMAESMAEDSSDKSSLPKPGDRSPKKYGPIDQVTLEAMAVATFLRGKNDEKLAKTMATEREKEAEILATSGITKEFFEDKFYGAAYEALLGEYQKDRQLIGFSDLGILGTGDGQDANHVEMYKDEMHSCYAALLIRQSRASVIVKQLKRRYKARLADKIFLKYQNDRKPGGIGIEKALMKFREAVTTQLSTSEESPVVGHNWIDDYSETMSHLSDMKHNPEKYMGYKCGIKHIDDQTKGFRPGHLSVFVGAHGGFKSTMMINVAFGLWRKGYDVLYASLEMEAELMEMKLWCRATKQVKFSSLYGGMMSDIGDWDKLDEIKEKLRDPNLNNEERSSLEIKENRLITILHNLDPADKGTREDATLIKKFYEERKNMPNKLMIVNAGQSNKIKPSQLANWLKEHENNFRPHVVIIDYLSLVAPESPYPDRRDQELGDICKYFRQLGKQRNFAVITAAQFKRAAVERIRNAEGALDKLQLGTDDIADSNQIGADADEVFMLLREDGGQRLRILTAKSRHGQMDIERGVTLQVKPDLCLIDSDDVIEDTSIRGNRITVQDGMETLERANDLIEKRRTPDDDFSFISNTSPINYGNGDFDDDLMTDMIDHQLTPKVTPSSVLDDDEEDF